MTNETKMTTAEIIKAVIEGKELQRDSVTGWEDYSHVIALRDAANVLNGCGFGGFIRIKPEPKPDAVSTRLIYLGSDQEAYTRWGTPNVKFTFSRKKYGETKLKTVAQIGKPCPEKMEALLRSIFTDCDWIHDDIYNVLTDVTKF